MRNLKAWTLLGLLVLGTAVPASAKTVITVYHRNETREAQWMQDVKKQFEAANPDIEVNLVEGIGGGDAPYAERLAVLWAAGNAPDVFYGAADKAGFILNGWTKDVTQYIQRDKKEMQTDDFFPGVFDASTRQGKNMGVPAIAMAQAVFYNKNMFAEAGLANPPVDWESKSWTWDDFLKASQKLTKFGPDNVPTQVAVNSISDTDFLWMNGGDRWSADAYKTGIAEKANLVTPENIKAFQTIQDYYVNKRYAAASPNSNISDWDGFWNGKVAMDWTGWWKVRNYADIASGGSMKFDWGIAPMPKVVNRANTRYSDPWFISSVTKHPDEAWKFVKFVTSKAGEVSYAQNVVFPPSRRSALQPYLETLSSLSGMSRTEAMTALSGALNNSRAAQDEIIGGMSVVSPIWSAELGPVKSGNKDVRQALESAQAKLDPALAELAARWKKK